MPDADLIALGRREVDAIGLARSADVVDGCVVRMPKAYPVYDDAYQDHLAGRSAAGSRRSATSSWPAGTGCTSTTTRTTR